MDAALFLFINQTLACAPLDVLGTGVNALGRWPLFWVGLGAAGLVAAPKPVRAFLLALIAAVASSDVVVNEFLKPLFARPRPLDVLDGVRVLPIAAANVGVHSFPSSHAANAFAMAVATALWFRKPYWTAGALALAALVAFFRVYGGVHYPGDVLGGALVGSALGAAAVQVARRLLNRSRRP